MKSQINKVVTEQSLSTGQPMKNIHGDEIEDSVVLDNYTFAYRDGSRFTVISEQPIYGDEIRLSLSSSALAALAALA